MQGGPEALIILPDNEFLKLHDVVFGLQEDEEFKKRLNISERDSNRLRFYGAHQSSLNRTLVRICDSGVCCDSLEEVSWVDYVEYFQPGAIDPDAEAVVVSYRNNTVYEIEARSIPQLLNSELKCGETPVYIPRFIREAIDRYVDFCRRLPESERLRRRCNLHEFAEDISRGKVWSKVSTDLVFTQGGFVRGRVVPRAVVWYVESRDLHPEIVDNNLVYVYKVERIPVNNYERGRRPSYEVFTYAYAVDVEPDDVKLVDVAMPFIKAVMRKRYGVELSLIQYCMSWGNLLKIWEKEPAGLLKRLQELREVEIRGHRVTCEELARTVASEEVDEYMKMLLQYFDPETFSERTDWGWVRKVAERFVYYICNAVPAVVGEKKYLVPKHADVAVIDKFGDFYYVTHGEVKKHTSLLDAIKEAAALAINRKIDAVVFYGPSEELEKVKKTAQGIIQILVQHYLQNITEKMRVFAKEPISLSAVRKEVFGLDDLLQIELQLNTMKIEGTEPAEDLEILAVKKRAETIVWLFNLINLLMKEANKN